MSLFRACEDSRFGSEPRRAESGRVQGFEPTYVVPSTDIVGTVRFPRDSESFSVLVEPTQPALVCDSFTSAVSFSSTLIRSNDMKIP